MCLHTLVLQNLAVLTVYSVIIVNNIVLEPGFEGLAEVLAKSLLIFGAFFTFGHIVVDYVVAVLVFPIMLVFD